jgi:hypothetical protein
MWELARLCKCFIFDRSSAEGMPIVETGLKRMYADDLWEVGKVLVKSSDVI